MVVDTASVHSACKYFHIHLPLDVHIGEPRKSKWLGLLILIPTADLVLYGILAFSKGAEKTGMVEDMPQAE